MLYAKNKTRPPEGLDPGLEEGHQVWNVPAPGEGPGTARRRQAKVLLVQPPGERVLRPRNRPSKAKRLRAWNRLHVMRTGRCAECRRKLTGGFARDRTGNLLCTRCTARPARRRAAPLFRA